MTVERKVLPIRRILGRLALWSVVCSAVVWISVDTDQRWSEGGRGPTVLSFVLLAAAFAVLGLGALLNFWVGHIVRREVREHAPASVPIPLHDQSSLWAAACMGFALILWVLDLPIWSDGRVAGARSFRPDQMAVFVFANIFAMASAIIMHLKLQREKLGAYNPGRLWRHVAIVQLASVGLGVVCLLTWPPDYRQVSGPGWGDASFAILWVMFTAGLSFVASAFLLCDRLSGCRVDAKSKFPGLYQVAWVSFTGSSLSRSGLAVSLALLSAYCILIVSYGVVARTLAGASAYAWEHYFWLADLGRFGFFCFAVCATWIELTRRSEDIWPDESAERLDVVG